MEKLRRIKVEGFRSFRNLELGLEDLTILIGANGAGKSNFIGFFDMLSHTLSGNLQLYVGRKGGGASILHYGPQQTPAVRAELDFGSDAGWSRYSFSLTFAAPDRLLFSEEAVQFHNADRPSPFLRALGSGQEETKLLDMADGPDDSTLRQVARVFVGRLRSLRVYHFHDTSESAHIRSLQDIDRNRFLASNGGNLAAFLYMLRETRPAHYKTILTSIRLAVPYLRDLILDPDRLNEGRIRLRWCDRNPDYEFGAHQLSDGSLRAIAMITALLQPEEMLPSVIFIDEPELGLHPSAIGVVAGLIKAVSAKRQVVVSTQSPRLLAEFEPNEAAVVERREDEGGRGESSLRRLSREDLGAWLDDYDLGALYEMNVTGGGPQ